MNTPKKILILNGSPKKGGNTETLVNWFANGARSKGTSVEIVRAALLAYKTNGCTSCRKCQKIREYECAINDDVRAVLKKMAKADIVVFATPLYFYGPSAQLKLIMDRMFSLYKWDNKTNTFESPMRGKTMVLLLSAYENIGLNTVRESFALIAEYSGMKFKALLVPNAGESGDIIKVNGISKKAIALGKSCSSAASARF